MVPNHTLNPSQAMERLDLLLLLSHVSRVQLCVTP